MDKNQFARYRYYDQQYRNFNKFSTKKGLKEELGISDKTFNLDRRAMEDIFDVKIIAAKNENVGYYYRYEDRDMSIYPEQLKQDELDRLELALQILSGISGLVLFDDFEDVMRSLRGYDSESSVAQDLEKFVSFQTDNWFNTAYFEDFFIAIRDKNVLNVSYKDFAEQEYEFEFHPYFLKHYNEMWYVFGYNPKELAYNWVLPLDRVQKIQASNKKYKENQQFNYDTYFDDIVGVTKPLKTEASKIKIRVSEDSVNFFNNKAMYPNQNPAKKEQDGKYYAYVNVRPNRELYNRLLMFGNSIEIVEPIEVRKELASRIKAAANIYEEI